MNNRIRRIESIDIFKLIFSIAVIAIHTEAFSDIDNSFAQILGGGVLAFAVPYFFLCSGFFLSGKLMDADNYRGSLVRYIKKLLHPFLIWGGVYFLCGVGIQWMNGYSFFEALKTKVHLLLVSSPGGGLWYVQSLLLMIVVLYIVGNRKKILTITTFFFILYILQFIVPFLPNRYSSRLIQTYSNLFLTHLNFAFWGIYVMMGVAVGLYRNETSKVLYRTGKWNIPVFILTYALYLFTMVHEEKSSLINGLLKLMVTLALFLTIIHAEIKIPGDRSILVRNISEIIYFTHYLSIYVVMAICKVCRINYDFHRTSAWVACSVLCCIWALIVLKTKIGQKYLMRLYERNVYH